MKPVVLYLDTSDYARLYRDDLEPGLAEVRAKLLSWVADGLITIPVSFFILFELLQESASARYCGHIPS